VPRSDAKFGLIRGLLLRADSPPPSSRRRPPAVFSPLLQTEAERLHLWRPLRADRDDLMLVTEVSSLVGDGRPWKTLSSCLSLTYFLASNGEAMVETGIQWLEEFDANSTFDTSPLAAPDEFRGLPELQDGWERFSAMVPLMESLVRDDGLYLAALRLRASLEAHWTCIHCALQGDDPPMHPSPEPESWQVLDWSIRIEAGLLQAVRACEGLLGQPNAGEPSARTLSRWRDAVDLDPEAPGFRSTGFVKSAWMPSTSPGESHTGGS